MQRLSMVTALIVVACASACGALHLGGTTTPNRPAAGATSSTTGSPRGSSLTTSMTAVPSATEIDATVVTGDVHGHPKDLVLQQIDLPTGFRTAAADPQGSSQYNVVYLRPTALSTAHTTGVILLAVISSVGVYSSA